MGSAAEAYVSLSKRGPTPAKRKPQQRSVTRDGPKRGKGLNNFMRALGSSKERIVRPAEKLNFEKKLVKPSPPTTVTLMATLFGSPPSVGFDALVPNAQEDKQPEDDAMSCMGASGGIMTLPREEPKSAAGKRIRNTLPTRKVVKGLVPAVSCTSIGLNLQQDGRNRSLQESPDTDNKVNSKSAGAVVTTRPTTTGPTSQRTDGAIDKALADGTKCQNKKKGKKVVKKLKAGKKAAKAALLRDMKADAETTTAAVTVPCSYPCPLTPSNVAGVLPPPVFFPVLALPADSFSSLNSWVGPGEKQFRREASFAAAAAQYLNRKQNPPPTRVPNPTPATWTPEMSPSPSPARSPCASACTLLSYEPSHPNLPNIGARPMLSLFDLFRIDETEENQVNQSEVSEFQFPTTIEDTGLPLENDALLTTPLEFPNREPGSLASVAASALCPFLKLCDEAVACAAAAAFLSVSAAAASQMQMTTSSDSTSSPNATRLQPTNVKNRKLPSYTSSPAVKTAPTTLTTTITTSNPKPPFAPNATERKPCPFRSMQPTNRPERIERDALQEIRAEILPFIVKTLEKEMETQLTQFTANAVGPIARAVSDALATRLPQLMNQPSVPIYPDRPSNETPAAEFFQRMGSPLTMPSTDNYSKFLSSITDGVMKQLGLSPNGPNPGGVDRGIPTGPNTSPFTVSGGSGVQLTEADSILSLLRNHPLSRKQSRTDVGAETRGFPSTLVEPRRSELIKNLFDELPGWQLSRTSQQLQNPGRSYATVTATETGPATNISRISR